MFEKLPLCTQLTQTGSNTLGKLWRISYSYNQDNYSSKDNGDQTSQYISYNTNNGMKFKFLSVDSKYTGCQGHILDL